MRDDSKEVREDVPVSFIPKHIKNISHMNRLKLEADLFSQKILAIKIGGLIDNPFYVWNDYAEEDVLLEKVRGRIVIIIDDMGIDQDLSKAVSDIEAPLTLSYLPYARNLNAQIAYGRSRGHDIMLHMPMQAMNGVMEATPGLLRVSDTQSDFLKTFDHAFEKNHFFRGVNNHMGSLLTQDEAKMNLFMRGVKERGLYFIDSYTIHTSVALEAAKAQGVPALRRDVFLDHENNMEFVRNALADVEEIALRRGYAIAIGHPKVVTISGLEEWLPHLQEKGLEVIGAEALILKIYPDFRLRDVSGFEQERSATVPPAGHRVVATGSR